ncbi:MAG TPA: DUF4129 domain-containing protein [Candidatus Thermoplasmatota archaeon]|nr:DUF4129 domain-containing protein [Candidatus Thermoplasmatota archaeon]
MRDVRPWLPFILFPLAGAFAGVLLGSLVGGLLPAVNLVQGLAGLVTLGLVVTATAWAAIRFGPRLRNAAARTPATQVAEAAPTPVASATTLAAGLTLPGLADGAPPVWGIGEALEIIVSATRDARIPAAGARARIVASGDAVAEGVLDARAIARFAIAFESPQSLDLVAEVEHAGAIARASRRLRIVRYEDEIKEAYQSMRVRAQESLPGGRDALTAREIADGLADRAPAAGAAILEATRIYEVVAYGERAADRATYLALARAVADVEAHIKPRQGAEARA